MDIVRYWCRWSHFKQVYWLIIAMTASMGTNFLNGNTMSGITDMCNNIIDEEFIRMIVLREGFLMWLKRS